MRPLTLSLSPSGGEGIETAPSPSSIERVAVRAETLASSGEARAEMVRVAHVFTHNPR
jgi:hypothetical protein